MAATKWGRFGMEMFISVRMSVKTQSTPYIEVSPNYKGGLVNIWIIIVLSLLYVDLPQALTANIYMIQPYYISGLM